MDVHLTKEHSIQDGEVVLDYIVKDWHTAVPGSWWRTPLDKAFFTEDEISELMYESGMSCPEDDKHLLDKAQQLNGPLWSSLNSNGEENLPVEAVEYLEFCEDYEESLHLERVKNAEVNLHRYLAVKHNFRENPSEPKYEFWESKNVNQDPENVDPPYTIGQLLCKDRITCDVTILNSFPIDRRGYALGVSDYGKVFITEKFRGYIPESGGSMKATVSLSDVELHNGRPRMCQLNLIYIH